MIIPFHNYEIFIDDDDGNSPNNQFILSLFIMTEQI